ncbi:MAG: outer membrane beta-barrel protein, partial [Candidatus Acidiferrales bacterium]
MLRQLAVACAVACMALPAYGQVQRGVHRGLTIELGGGFDDTQFNSSGWPNYAGYYGSIGVNVTSWLQIYADGNEQFASVSGGNTRLYGDHIGGRFYYRRYQALNPFAEALFGASRLDLNLTPGGQRYSENGFSFRTGGGLDFNVDRHWSVRA